MTRQKELAKHAPARKNKAAQALASFRWKNTPLKAGGRWWDMREAASASIRAARATTITASQTIVALAAFAARERPCNRL
jgi:hypothetical protein